MYLGGLFFLKGNWGVGWEHGGRGRGRRGRRGYRGQDIIYERIIFKDEINPSHSPKKSENLSVKRTKTALSRVKGNSHSLKGRVYINLLSCSNASMLYRIPEVWENTLVPIQSPFRQTSSVTNSNFWENGRMEKGLFFNQTHSCRGKLRVNSSHKKALFVRNSLEANMIWNYIVQAY